jgi:Protein of unknown function (DUF4446)
VAELTSPVGIVALAAAGVAVLALAVAGALAWRLRALRRAQQTVLGDRSQDLVAHAAGLHDAFVRLQADVDRASAGLHKRLAEAERRLDGAIAYRSLVRYDAYNEMSGRQSTSIALLDASRSGLVLSSILHREQARLYAKHVHGGEPELELSPEEAEAVRLALSGGVVQDAAQPTDG